MNYFQKLKKLNDFFKNNWPPEFQKYMKSRGIKPSTAKEFEVGYNGGKSIISFPYDYTNNLITFPMYDMFGRVVAFRCRNLDTTPRKMGNLDYEPPRYIGNHNYPTLYEAGRMIFNLPKVLTKYYNRRVFVVEGPFDMISLWQVGIKNVVSLNTNNMSEIQAEILYRYFDKIVFVLDDGVSGDEMLMVKKAFIKTHPHVGRLQLLKVKFQQPYKDPNDILSNNLDLLRFIKENKQII